MKNFSKILTFGFVALLLGLFACQDNQMRVEENTETISDTESILTEALISESGVSKPVISAPVFMKPAARRHYNKRVLEIMTQTPLTGGVVFIGDDFTENANWQALFPEVKLRNQGIIGDTTSGLEKRTALLAPHKPVQVYVMIGCGDGVYGRTSQDMTEAIFRIVQSLHTLHPTAQIFIQSPIPADESSLKWCQNVQNSLAYLMQDPEMIATGVEYIDVLSAYINAQGRLRTDLYSDTGQLDMHGYAVWGSILSRFVAKTIH